MGAGAHYDVALLPTRSYRPRDKSVVESAVGHIILQSRPCPDREKFLARTILMEHGRILAGTDIVVPALHVKPITRPYSLPKPYSRKFSVGEIVLDQFHETDASRFISRTMYSLS